jgi:hypothetical protein
VNVQCQVCAYTYTAGGRAGSLTEVTCPQCGVKARLIQVPMGRSVNGRDEQPGMPAGNVGGVRAMTAEESVAATRAEIDRVVKPPVVK